MFSANCWCEQNWKSTKSNCPVLEIAKPKLVHWALFPALGATLIIAFVCLTLVANKTTC